MATKGRKRTIAPYFGPEQEEAVILYVASDDQLERNIIYSRKLHEPLNKMVEYIIKRYKLYRKGMSFEEQHMDALGDLIMKADKFDGGRGKKAYSYYGTIIKRYLIGKLIDDDKNMKKYSSFDDVSSYLETKDEYQYELTNHDDFNITKFMFKLIDEIKVEIDKGLKENEKHPTKKKFTDNEQAVGYALIDILENWETIFEDMGEGSKYNKIAILETMRNNTGLTTKDIRLAMKRYKTLYDFIKIEGIEKGLH
jgi:hypothetical protein